MKLPKVSLTWKILIGLVLGIFIGWALHESDIASPDHHVLGREFARCPGKPGIARDQRMHAGREFAERPRKADRTKGDKYMTDTQGETPCFASHQMGANHDRGHSQAEDRGHVAQGQAA